MQILEKLTPNHRISPSISVGFTVGEFVKTMNELFKEADNNMYREKLIN
jgi:GGDEF domain-containing protein